MQIFVWPQFHDSYVEDNFEFLPAVSKPANGSDMLLEQLARDLDFQVERLGPYFSRNFLENGAARGCKGPSACFTIGDGIHPNEYGTEIAANAIKDLSEESQPVITSLR